MAIKHDSQGFLIGDLIESSKSMLETQQAGMGVWRGIRSDVSAIARAMGVSARSNARAPGSPSVSEPSRRTATSGASQRGHESKAVAMSARSRGANGRFSTSAPVNRSAIKSTATAAARGAAVPLGARDTKGRFSQGAGGPGGDGGDYGGSGGGILADKLGKVVDAFKGLSQGGENVDPAITAVSEIKSVLEPFGRGAFALFGRNPERKKERWYAKFLKALKGRDGGSTVITGGDGGSGMALPMRLISGIGRMVVGALGLVGAAGLGVYLGTKIYEWLDKSGIATKIFDAFDAVGAWFKSKTAGITSVIAEVKSDYATGKSQGLNAGGGSNNSHRQMEDAMPPVSSVANGAGRAVGAVQRSMAALATKRKRATFRAIKGGSMMEAYGTYTDDEASRVRSLKFSGANTGAFGRGGMTMEMQTKIAERAKKYGLDPAMMQKIVAMESGGNANAISSTGAIGLMQIVGDTATRLDVKDRFNADQNLDGGMRLAVQNSAMLEKATLPVTAENVYMMHQLGPRAAMEIIRGAQKGLEKSQLSLETQKSMNLNYGSKSTTAQGYLSQNSRALDDRLALTTGGLKGFVATASSASMPAPKSAALPMPVPQKVPAAPDSAIPAPSAGNSGPDKRPPLRESIAQNMADRHIAHIASGGIGANGRW